jgi:DNA-binding response OmpR family regulator
MKRVLVVEDDREVNTLICRLLGQRGFACESAYSAGQCEEILARHGAPDIILMDLELPDMDGAELSVQLRRRASMARVPILVMTGYPQESQLDRVRASGADDHILKPFSPKEMLAKVTEMTGGPTRHHSPIG